MEYEARVAAIRQETPTVKSFFLDLKGEELTFLPGQYIDLYVDTLDGTEVGGYSVTSSPFQHDAISIAVKRLPHAKPAIHLHREAKVGDVYPLVGPGGDFYYQQDMGTSVVFIAGGIGITPFMSMMRYINEARLDVQTTLLYSAKTPAELVFFEELTAMSQEALNITCRFTITQAHTELWDGREGRIDAQMLKESTSRQDTVFFICGPNDMPTHMTQLLRELGIEESRIKTEVW